MTCPSINIILVVLPYGCCWWHCTQKLACHITNASCTYYEATSAEGFRDQVYSRINDEASSWLFCFFIYLHCIITFCKRHYCMCTIHYIELPFSKFYLLYFVFLCYKSKLHPKVFLTHFLMSRLNCITSTFRKQKQHHMSLFANFYSIVNQGAVSKSMSTAV